MSDRELSELFAAAPDVPAGEAFVARVGQGMRRRRATGLMLAAAAVTACAGAAGLIAWTFGGLAVEGAGPGPWLLAGALAASLGAAAPALVRAMRA